MKTRPWIAESELDNPTHVDAQDAIQAASFLLFQLSGQKYTGLQRITEQYVCEDTGAPVGCKWDPGHRGYWNPRIDGYTYVMGPRERSITFLPGKRIRLRYKPVHHVEEILISDVAQDLANYSVLNGSVVSRDGSWPLCAGMTITYDFGTNPPALGRIAARRLANELILLADGSEHCALPSNVTTVTRQGLTITMFDPQDFLNKGQTGIYEVDMFIAASNPYKYKKPARVFSPDVPRGYHRS